MLRVIRVFMSLVGVQCCLMGMSEVFDVGQDVARGCSLSPFFLCSLNGLLVAVEQAVLCIELSEVGGLLFADDFGKVSDSGEKLQRLIYVVDCYCQKRKLTDNISKSTVERVL